MKVFGGADDEFADAVVKYELKHSKRRVNSIYFGRNTFA
jgi:hypothetical protein